MDFNQALNNCESEIEEHLLRALYPKLDPAYRDDLRSQHVIDYYRMPVTIPDFAFPKDKIAIYCDGYEHHSERDSFQKDRQQSRELQLQDWYVLRFTGSEILYDTESVVATIQQAIKTKRKAPPKINKRPKGETWEIIQFALIGVAFAVIILKFFLASLF